jgi:hypothetical protein
MGSSGTARGTCAAVASPVLKISIVGHNDMLLVDMIDTALDDCVHRARRYGPPATKREGAQTKDGQVFPGGTSAAANRGLLTELAARHRLPAIYTIPAWVA